MKPTGPNQLAHLAVGSLLAVLPFGCGDKAPKPKREDHETRHTLRYHPDIHQHDAPTVATFDPATASRPASGVRKGPAGKPVLFVNSDCITVPEILEPIAHPLAMQAAKLSPSEYDALLVRAAASEIRRQVSALVIYQEARHTFPDDVDEVLDKRADEMIDNVVNREFGGVRAKYEAALDKLGLTLEDVKTRTKRQILSSQFLQERFSPLLQEPSRQERVRYYESHLDEFTTPASAEMFLIEIPLKSAMTRPAERPTAEQMASARQTARLELERALEEISSGVEFEAVARRYSKGVQRANGGAWGEITQGTLQKRWAKAEEILFTLKAGRMSEIVETDESFFIVKCGKMTPAKTRSFEEAQYEIIARFKEEQYNNLTTNYINGLILRTGITLEQQQGFMEAVLAAAPKPPTNGDLGAR